jgi:hypothetical protein
LLRSVNRGPAPVTYEVLCQGLEGVLPRS